MLRGTVTEIEETMAFEKFHEAWDARRNSMLKPDAAACFICEMHTANEAREKRG